MRSLSSKSCWKLVASMALILGLVLGLILGRRADLDSTSLLTDIVSFTPSVSAPPPRSKESSDEGLVTAYAEVDGRSYQIVVGRTKRPSIQNGLWSATFPEDEEPRVVFSTP